MSFDEFKKEFGVDESPYSAEHYIIEAAFKAGQQSQQAKIDEFKKLRSFDEMAINQLSQANQVWQIKCDELQGRIDGAIGSLNLVNHAMLYEHIDHIINLLDGTTNEQ